MIKRYKQVLATVIIASIAINSSAFDRESTTINDLRYGEALYHFYQEQYFSAITNLLVAKNQKAITKQGADPEILLGGLYLYYGLHQNAAEIFTDLIEHNTSQETQDQAWFNIGKMGYRGHFYSKAQQALLKVKNTLSSEREAERQNMLANTYLSEQNYSAAYGALKQLKTHKDWKMYAQYNIGIALIKSGKNKEGTDLLDQISIIKTNDIELKALRDKTNIALGYVHIRNKNPEKATKYLKRVRLKGPLSAKALLGIGWSYQQQQQLEKALVPWMELRNWPVIDTAVQESLLAIPYTLEQMGKNKLALQHYNYAVDNYKNELEGIENLLNAIKAGELLFALRPAMVTENILAPEYTNKLPESIAVPYLHHLLNSVDFQITHKNYLDLIYLRKNLINWKNQFPAYYLMLKERRANFKKLQNIIKNDPRLTLIKTLINKRDKLAKEVSRIKRTHDVFALATAEEKNMLDSLNKIKLSLAKSNNKDGFSEEKGKYKLLHGLLNWDISTDFQPRYWKAKNELNQVNKAIKITLKSLYSLKLSNQNAPRAFSGFEKQIKSKEKILKKILNKISQLLSAQEKHLEEQAITSLRKRYHQIENYHIRARYSLARLYDRLTLPAKANVTKKARSKSDLKVESNK